MRLREDRILRSNGEPGIYGVVEKDDAPLFSPSITTASGWWNSFATPFRSACWSCPRAAGDGVSTLRTGPRELREEIGMEAAEMTHLGTLWIAYGFARQRQHVFLATGLTATEKDLIGGARPAVRPVPVEEFEEMMRSGVIRDNCTLSAWGLYLLWKARQGDPAAH